MGPLAANGFGFGFGRLDCVRYCGNRAVLFLAQSTVRKVTVFATSFHAECPQTLAPRNMPRNLRGLRLSPRIYSLFPTVTPVTPLDGREEKEVRTTKPPIGWQNSISLV